MAACQNMYTKLHYKIYQFAFYDFANIMIKMKCFAACATQQYSFNAKLNFIS